MLAILSLCMLVNSYEKEQKMAALEDKLKSLLQYPALLQNSLDGSTVWCKQLFYQVQHLSISSQNFKII
jgi:hypothetical protein